MNSADLPPAPRLPGRAGAGTTRQRRQRALSKDAIVDAALEIVDREGARDITTVDGHVAMDHVDFSYVPGVPILSAQRDRDSGQRLSEPDRRVGRLRAFLRVTNRRCQKLRLPSEWDCSS